jgi:phthiodiolone/phenolphthiodiolone dimycocerosates ketoreductase
LGIGAGEAMNLTPVGLPFDEPVVRARRLEEAVQVVRLLWRSSRRSPVNFSGKYFTLTNAWLDLEMTHPPPPIYIGAFGGPRMMEIVGKHADGWISWVNTPDTFRERLWIARDAALRAGRTADQVRGVAWMFVSMARSEEDIAKAISYTKISLLMEAHTLRFMGVKLPEAITTPYQSMTVSDETDRLLVELQNAVPDEIALKCLAFGSPSQIIERIERFKDAGASHIMVEFTERGKAPLEDFAREILPHFDR